MGKCDEYFHVVVTQLNKFTMGICISRPPAPCLPPGPGSQSVFLGPGSQFVFTGHGPQFLFTSPGPQFLFTGPNFPNLYLPVLAPDLCLPALVPICIYQPQFTILLPVPSPSFAYTDLVCSICVCIYGPGLRFVLSIWDLNLHLPYYWQQWQWQL